MKGYIYKYTFSNGKIYIGQCIDFKQRHKQHLNDTKYKFNKTPWKLNKLELAIHNFGEPKYEIIEEIELESWKQNEFKYLLNLAENKWINYYNSKENGYNTKSGSILGNGMTLEDCKKYDKEILEHIKKIYNFTDKDIEIFENISNLLENNKLI